MNLRRLVIAAFFAGSAAAGAQQLPNGFHRTDPVTDRDLPTGVYFAHDGEVFVTEKNGRAWRYANLLDTAPVQFADISAEIHTIGDRGLLGFALDPRYPEVPRVYMLYAFNGGLFDDLPPRWGSDCGSTVPETPDPGTPGGCVVSGHLSRFDVVDGIVDPASETVLIEDWYQFFPSHSIGTLLFGEDGYLYAGGGDGASYNWTDWGQGVGNPDFPDERSPTIGGVPEGGALRSQGLEVETDYADQQVWLDGAILRLNPATGEGAPDNPLAATGLSENARRIVAYGLRNPFRFTERRGTGEIWVGDVGWNTWEEVNRIPALATDGTAALVNFGWPCFEGRGHTQGYAGSNLPICQTLYSNGDTGGRTPWTPPWYAYVHTASSDITGLAFYTGTSYPEAYRNSLFTADNSRSAIFNFPFVDANGDGVPDAPPDSSVSPFYGGFEAPAVQLMTGPGGDIFYPNINLGRISRLSYCDGCTNVAPSAAIALDAGSTGDGAPRTIDFTASNSVDPDSGDALTYDWDLDGDGTFGDASGTTASRFYATEGSYRVAVRVTDTAGASDTQTMLVTVTGSIEPADVGVTFDDHATSTAPGEIVDYALVVTNYGTNTVTGEHVATATSAQLRDVLWACDASGGGVCPASSGDGDIDADVTLPGGTFVTFHVLGIVRPLAEGTIDSTASITPPPNHEDPNLADNAATDSDIIITDRLFADGFDG
ncbi:MAG: PQQ-dependent sugar dehydrogenase [Rhodanobacteraceae bacterium]